MIPKTLEEAGMLLGHHFGQESHCTRETQRGSHCKDFSFASTSASRKFAVVRLDLWNFLDKSKHHNLKQEKIAKK